MWLVEIFSEGDLCGEKYLYTRPETVEQDPETGKYWYQYYPRFKDPDDIVERLEYIDSCMDRLQKEKDFLLRNAQQILEVTIEYEDIPE